MSYIKEIIKTEEVAKETIQNARIKANEKLLEAGQHAKRTLDLFEKNLSQQHLSSCEAQKGELATLYKNFLESAETEKKKIQTIYKKHEEEAVAYIVQHILK